MKSNITSIGTWNVRSLARCGKLEELNRELDNYKWDVIAIEEIRWTGTGDVTTDIGHKLMYSYQDKLKRYGVGFIVRK